MRRSIRRRLNALLSSWRQRPTPGRILLYHEVREGQDPVAAVRPGLFRAQLEWLGSHGIRATSIATMRRDGAPAGVVALSFDDGHASLVHAFDLIADAGCSATAFVVPGWIDSGERAACSWSELAALAGRGLEIGSHDLAHERPCGAPVGSLAERYRIARITIEDRLGVAVAGIAYPYGLAPARARRAAALAGYSYAVTSEPGANGARTDPFRLRRNEIHGTDDSPRVLIGKLAGTDDWFRPVRRLENRLACG